MKDDAENPVRSITNRIVALLSVAETACPVMQDKERMAVQKVQAISKMMQDAPGCGDTWTKMMTA